MFREKSVDQYIKTDGFLINVRRNIYPIWRRWGFLQRRI